MLGSFAPCIFGASADRCVQVMGGQGVTEDTIVEQVFREIRAFRIYDGPSSGDGDGDGDICICGQACCAPQPHTTNFSLMDPATPGPGA